MQTDPLNSTRDLLPGYVHASIFIAILDTHNNLWCGYYDVQCENEETMIQGSEITAWAHTG